MVELNDWNSQMRRGLLELSILGLLEARPDYGYQIVTRLAAAPNLAAGEGTVYPLLRRLRKVGWLETTWEESDSGPPRQIYRLSPEGRQYLKALRAEWKRLVASVDTCIEAGKGRERK